MSTWKRRNSTRLEAAKVRAREKAESFLVLFFVSPTSKGRIYPNYAMVPHKGLMNVSCVNQSPIQDAPERIEVRGSSVLVVEIIGMFPHIERQ